MTQGENISVVVQGPVHGRPTDPPEQRRTLAVLASVRRQLPKAEIILSTWRASDPTGLPFDQLILNDDPGAVPLNDTTFKHISNNLNRQLVSTSAGLAAASREYAIKLRTDCVLLRPVDFSVLQNRRRDPAWSILEKPVGTLTTITRHPLRRPVLFHLSDIFHFGLLGDLRKIWRIPLVAEPAFTRAIDPNFRPGIEAFPGVGTECFMRCAPEQYLMERLIQEKSPGFSLTHPADGGTADLFNWLHLLANNFRVLTPALAGVEMPQSVLTKNAIDWDFIRSDDEHWLQKWAKPAVAAPTRWFASVRFRLMQIAYRRSCYPLRPLWQRILGRTVRATS